MSVVCSPLVETYINPTNEHKVGLEIVPTTQNKTHTLYCVRPAAGPIAPTARFRRGWPAIGRRQRQRQAEAELLGLGSGRNLRTSGGIGPSAGCRGRQDLRAPTTANETHGALLAAVGAGVGGHVRGRVVHGCGPAPSIEVRGLGACAGCWARGRGVRKGAAHRVEGGGSALADDLSM